MNCHQVERLLSLRMERELTAREAEALEVHLGQCLACRGREAAFLALRSGLRTLASQLPRSTVALEQHAIDTWLAEQRAPGRTGLHGCRSPFVSWGARPLAAWGTATALLLALLARSWSTHHWARGRAPRSPRLVTVPETPPLVAPPERHGPELGHPGKRPVPVPPFGPGGTGRTRRSSGTRLRSVKWGSDRRPATSADPSGLLTRHYSQDLAYWNADPDAALGPWARLPADAWDRIETRVRRVISVRDDFVQIPLPRLAATSDRAVVAATEAYRREAAIVDARLVREVTAAFKATALSDLCDRLRADTGIHLTAAPSVADQKVTLFCEDQPLRDLMRELSRPFGYTWLRSGPAGEYRYELVQDLKSQLIEEELRNRDQHAALLALDQEMGEYRPYFGLTPDEALARAKTAPPAEKKLLERYAGKGWGPAQLYFRLSPADIARLRAGERVTYSLGPAPGEQPLPADLAAGALQSFRHARLRRQGDQFQFHEGDDPANGSAPAATPDARPDVTLELARGDLGQFTLIGGTGIKISARPGDGGHWLQEEELAVGISPTVREPQNAQANARLAHDPLLQKRLSIAGSPASPPAPASTAGSHTGPAIRRVTTADVLEALHRATGLPIVADFYTRLYPAERVRVRDQRLFDALNQLSDALRLRWRKDGTPGRGAWLQFRSTSFFHDRLKEVPNRLLSRWAVSRKEHGALTLDDLIEIVQLPDAPLDARSMADGAEEIWGLAEWDLARRPSLRPHLRFLAGLTPAQRQEAQTRAGLAFRKLSWAQQQQYLALALGDDVNRLPSLDALAEATLRVDYSLPGAFEWRTASPSFLSRQPPSLEPSLVRAPTRAAALEAARRRDPQVPEQQIVPTELAMIVQYSLGPNTPYRPTGIRASRAGTLNLVGLEPR